MNEFKIAVNGNKKLGKMVSINLPALVTCPAGAECRKFCYANKGHYLYPNVQGRYFENYDYYLENGAGDTLVTLSKQLLKTDAELVRWHASGDIPDYQYFIMMISLAFVFPDKKFMVYTKKYDIVNRALDTYFLPDNLTVIFSVDNNLELFNPHQLPLAIVHETRTTCPNQIDKSITCNDCKKCWRLTNNQTIIFRKH